MPYIVATVAEMRRAPAFKYTLSWSRRSRSAEAQRWPAVLGADLCLGLGLAARRPASRCRWRSCCGATAARRSTCASTPRPRSVPPSPPSPWPPPPPRRLARVPADSWSGPRRLGARAGAPTASVVCTCHTSSAHVTRRLHMSHVICTCHTSSAHVTRHLFMSHVICITCHTSSVSCAYIHDCIQP